MRGVVFGALSLALIAAGRTPAVWSLSESTPDQVAVRQIGALERVSRDPLQSVSTALPMPDGRVLVNDARSRRILMLDSTLSNPRVLLDTTAATSNAYPRGSGGSLFRFKADSALFLDPGTLTMFLIAPAGEVARIMAFPPPPGSRGGMLFFGLGSVPTVDPRGRLLYVAGSNAPGIFMLSVGTLVTPEFLRMLPEWASDSARVLRVDLATRQVDTIAALKNTRDRRQLRTDASGRLEAIDNFGDPLPLVDEWTMLPDGAVAVVRARDYHIDWLEADGRRSSTSRMPFDWQQVTDERKRALVDSTVAAVRARMSPNPTGRGGGTGAGSPPMPPQAPNVAVATPVDEVPDSVPPFKWGIRAVQADAEGNVWIRTSTVMNGRPVYDIVNRKGEIFDRVQLPAFRTIVGFGPGVVYMAVADGTNVVRLERARIK